MKASRRIQRELVEFTKSPPEFVPKIAIDGDNMHKVFFLIEGLTNSTYAGGSYVVMATLPSNYPMSPPAICMLTPNGRFIPERGICTTFTRYHPESWSPAYTFSTIMKSLVSFMLHESPSSFGSIRQSDQERITMAMESHAYNEEHGYNKLFA